MYLFGDVVINDIYVYFFQFFVEVLGEMIWYIVNFWCLFVCGVWECVNGIIIQWVIVVVKCQKSCWVVVKGDNKMVIFDCLL